MVSTSTFLNRPEWKTIPFSSNPKTDIDGFLDLLLDEISLIEQGGQLAGLPAESLLSATVELTIKCWRLDHQLEQFYERLKSKNSSPLFWPILLSDNDRLGEQSDTLGLVYFEFCSVKVAANMILYWASLTVLWSGMARLYNVLDELGALYYPSLSNSSNKKEIYEKIGVPDRGHIQNFIVTARKVCSSVVFGSRDELGMHMIVAPLIMLCHALRPWKQYSEEIAWAESKLEEIQHKGMRILKYNKSIVTI
jgi:hypothetical protein